MVKAYDGPHRCTFTSNATATLPRAHLCGARREKEGEGWEEKTERERECVVEGQSVASEVSVAVM
jgi:hypothetical protein